MADAVVALSETARLYAEIAHIDYKPSVKGQIAVFELVGRLYSAATE